ncbi:MAG: hypothetical protein Q9182_006654 [Xanthomendoza sp. 2 TL-2023]
MSRTVADATRFTATSPHAFGKPASFLRTVANTISPSSAPSTQPPRRQPNLRIPKSSPPPQGRPPDQETPRQKVDRIRAMRAAAKAEQFTLWDRIVIRGRVVADVAHMITVYFLIASTVVAFFITTFSLTDMILYNRRKRKEWSEAEAAIYEQTLYSALTALRQKDRPLTDEEQDVMERETAALEAEAKKEAKQKKKKGGWGIKKWVFGEMEMGTEAAGGKVWRNTEGDGRESLLGAAQQDGVVGAVADVEESVAVGEMGSVAKAVEEKRREGEKAVEGTGGPLDRSAEGVVEKARRGWDSWFGAR